MNPFTFTLTTLAASSSSIVNSVTPTSGTALTIVGGGSVTLDVARRVLLTFGNEAAARTLTVGGTDRYGNTISEVLAVASGASGSVQSQQDFKTVTSALPLGGGWTAAITLGTNAVASSPWFQRDWGVIGRLGVLMRVTSGPTVQLEITMDDINIGNVGGQWYPYGSSVEPLSTNPPLASIAPTNATTGPPYNEAGTASAWSGLAGVHTYGGEFNMPCFAMRMTQTAGSGTSTVWIIEETADRKEAY